MFDILCSYPLPTDLFAQAIHPSTPLVAAGLASGHLRALRLPTLGSSSGSSAENEDDYDDAPPPRKTNGLIKRSSASPGAPDGKSMIQTAWQTKRHKGSCRALAFSPDGESLVSGGSDGLLKVAESETGKVKWKIKLPGEGKAEASPFLLRVLSPQTVLVATDSPNLHIYDFRAPANTDVCPKPQATHQPHIDYVSSLTSLPPTDASTSGFSKQWVSTGGGTLAVTDLRRGVMARSENQEDDLMSSVYITGFAKRGSSQGEKVVVGTSTGVLTLWEKGVWDDQDERIVVDGGKGGGECLDALVEVPGGLNGNKAVAVGMGDGNIKLVSLGKNKVVGTLGHDDLEGVLGLGFEPEGRMVSGGGAIVKVWGESWSGEGFDGENSNGKRDADGDDSSSEDDSSDVSEDDEKDRKRRKKRKRNKGKDKSGGKPIVPSFKGLD